MARQGLAYLAIYKPDLGVTEETVARQLLFYTAAPPSHGPHADADGDGKSVRENTTGAGVDARVVSDLDTQLRNVGLVQGIVELGNSFAHARRPSPRSLESPESPGGGSSHGGSTWSAARDVGVQCITTKHTVSWVLQLEPPSAPADRAHRAEAGDGRRSRPDGAAEGSGVWAILCMHTNASTTGRPSAGGTGGAERRAKAAQGRTPDTAQVLAELRRAYAQFRLEHGSFAHLLGADLPAATLNDASDGDGTANADADGDGAGYGDSSGPGPAEGIRRSKKAEPKPPTQKALARIERWWLRWAYGWRAVQRPVEVSLRGLRLPALSAAQARSGGAGDGDRARSASSARPSKPAATAPAGTMGGIGLSLSEWRRVLSICRQRTAAILEDHGALRGVVLVARDERHRRACLYHRSPRRGGDGCEAIGNDNAQALIDFVAVEELRRRARSSHVLAATAAAARRPPSPTKAATLVPNAGSDYSTSTTIGRQQAPQQAQASRSTSGAASWLSADRWVAETSKVISLMSIRRTGGDDRTDDAAAAAAPGGSGPASKQPEWWFAAGGGKSVYLDDKLVGYNVVDLAHLQVILLHDLAHDDERDAVNWAALLRQFSQLDTAVGAVLTSQPQADDARSSSRSRGRAGIVAAAERDRSGSRGRSRTPARGDSNTTTNGHFYNLVHSPAAGLFWSTLPTIKHDLAPSGAATTSAAGGGGGVEDGIGLDLQALAALADSSLARPADDRSRGLGLGKSSGQVKDPAQTQHERNVADNAAALHRQLYDLCAVERRRSARRRNLLDDDDATARHRAGDRADVHVVRTARNVWLAVARFDHAQPYDNAARTGDDDTAISDGDHARNTRIGQRDPDLVVLARPAKQGETLEAVARQAEREALSLHARFVEAAALFDEGCGHDGAGGTKI